VCNGFVWDSLKCKRLLKIRNSVGGSVAGLYCCHKHTQLQPTLRDGGQKGVLEQKSKMAAPSFTAENRMAMVNRAVRLTFTYRFGEMSAGGKHSKKSAMTIPKAAGKHKSLVK